jgi:sterol desaturase/sphingolipid hydroxylase (fatty acid hydroxylase superfamily)
MATFFPSWGKAIVAVSCLSLYAAFGLEFVAGLVLYFLYYEIRHQRAHRREWVKHHMDHHFSDPHSNFSGMVPTIDRIFKTYA